MTTSDFYLQKVRVKIKKLTETAQLPTYAHSTDAGIDLVADESVTLYVSHSKIISTGIALAIPVGYFGLMRPRSGLAASSKITMISSGVIDSGYRGEIKVQLINHGTAQYTITRGDRIAQLIIIPIMHAVLQEVEELPQSDRGAYGYGSTGK